MPLKWFLTISLLYTLKYQIQGPIIGVANNYIVTHPNKFLGGPSGPFCGYTTPLWSRPRLRHISVADLSGERCSSDLTPSASHTGH